MEEIAAGLLPVARIGVLANFLLLALAAGVRAPRSGASGRWVAGGFSALAVALLITYLPGLLGLERPTWLGRAPALLILAFPYLLLRFTASFRPFPRWLEVVAAVTTVAVALATIALPAGGVGDPGGAAWVRAHMPVALTHWALLSLVTVVRLWQAGSGQPTVARRRMRLMSAATAVLVVALVLATRPGHLAAPAALSVELVALIGAMSFGLGFAPPRALRLAWRRAEEEHLQRATTAMLRAGTLDEVAHELLPPTVSIVGGAGAAFVDPDGRVLAGHGLAPEPGAHLPEAADAVGGAVTREVAPLGEGRGQLIVWTSPYTPFFGQEESALVRAMAAVASLALERCELLADERAQRAALEQAQRAADEARREEARARGEAERAREEATRANTAKTDFLARMSHELRTPLNAILGFGQLLEIAELGDDDHEAVQHILKAGRHLLALINDVLDLAGIEAGTLTISLEPVHAGELVRDTLTLIQPLAGSRSIRLTAAGDGDVYVRTDRQRCRQVLLNLLSNAVKYNHDGGEVEVRCSRVGDALRVAVRDSGPGIDHARQRRLFEPFDRLGAEASGVEGTGLGLALSKQLIERLGGGIGVDTAPGRGSTFWIDLPVTAAPPDCDDIAPPPLAPPRAGQRTLLLVEDNLANLRVVEAMLRKRPGIAVMPAMQGGLAVELALEHQPDVIVLDLHLPDLSGREVLHRLRADPRTRDIPVVIASADATARRVGQLRDEGAFAYVTKPLDLQRFLQVVDAAVARRDAARPAPDGPPPEAT